MTAQPTPMTPVSFEALDIDALATATGRVAVVLEADGKMDAAGRRINKLTRGALARLAAGKAFGDLKEGGLTTLAMPAGMAADAVDVLCLSRRPTVQDARKAGAALAKVRGTADLLVAAGSTRHAADLGFGLAMRDYGFNAHKSDAKPASDGGGRRRVLYP